MGIINREVFTKMRIEIHVERFCLNRHLYRYIRRKVLACIGEWKARVRKVMVSLTDVMLGCGSIEKRCLVEMELDGLPGGVVCQQIDRDTLCAIDRSMACMGGLLRCTLLASEVSSG
ncbi:hypothetical protein NB231_06581 [Nitrococcus mobilis Nb-231]|uniref:Uncharacterized protein n=2 Tax=Nitrococcus mobilis TaxID=35797 RepID=A4BR33_9GAMM|nr:hypothetical protein NB231_06581 [Nitrococcus mobilis Nb-231]